jgi:hypothetical protein
MADGAGEAKAKPGRQGSLLGSLKDALAAASRDDTMLAAQRAAVPAVITPAPDAEVVAVAPPPLPAGHAAPASDAQKSPMSAAEAAREARGVTSLKPLNPERHMEFDGGTTTRILRSPKAAVEEPAQTQLVRGRQPLKRGQFAQDPVVGWLVIVGGPGLGTYRPVFEGNNTIGRAPSNRIPLDFGDEAISAEEQAYLRYDSADRTFLFVPNLSKTNVVQVNSKKPTSAVELAAMDVIVMGRTQLVFAPFCGPDFDWSEITESKD